MQQAILLVDHNLAEDTIGFACCQYDPVQERLYSETCPKRPLKRRPKIGFQDRLSLYAGHKYCRMLQESILQYFRPSVSYRLS